MSLRVVLLLSALAAAVSASAQYYGHATGRRVSTYAASGASSRPWWTGLFPSSAPSSAFLPDEREIFPEWFEAEEAEECQDVPETVNTGRPRDLCGNDDLDRRFCICLKRPRRATAYHVPGYGTAQVAGSEGGGYEAICGECRDPCALRFIPDTYPRRRSSDEDDEDNDDDNNQFRRNN